MPYDQIENKTYKFALNCVDIATHTKQTYPLTKRDSANVAKGILMNEHGIQIQLANSKESMGIIERFNRTLQEQTFFIQDGVEMRLSLTECC